MNEFSHKHSPSKASLELDAESVRARIGEKRFRLIKLWVRDVTGAFDAALARHIGRTSSVLDAGSSRGDPDLPALKAAQRVIACDADEAGLRGNRLVRERVAAVLERLPFSDASFDVVACKFVVEHLAAPGAVFGEFWRVLRPGGVVAVLTPNRWSLFAGLSSLLPHHVKSLFKERLFGGHEEDTFETLYRANTVRRLTGTMARAGFVLERVEMVAGMWAFFAFNRALALFVRGLERLQAQTPLLRGASTYILGVWRKPALAG